MKRAALLLLATIVVLPTVSPAHPPTRPGSVYDAFAAGAPAHDRGELRGIVEAVDYGSNTIVVRASDGHRSSLVVLPSTQIFIRNTYATLADVREGSHIDVTVSEVGGRLVAQIIRLQ